MTRRSSKRASFEEACAAAGLKYWYAKEGIAFMDDPGFSGEPEGPFRPFAIVRLRPRVPAILGCDVPLFLAMVERGVPAYVFTPDSGFVPMTALRLGRRVMLGPKEHDEELPGAPAAAAPPTPPAARGATVDPIPAGTALVDVRDALVEARDFRVIRQDPNGTCTVGPALPRCCSAPTMRTILHRPEGGCRSLTTDDVAAGKEG